MSDQGDAAVYLSDGSGEGYLLADPSQLTEPSMILTDPQSGDMLMVNSAEFMDAGYSVGVDRDQPEKRRRRLFGRGGSA